MSMPHPGCCLCVECELSRALADRDRRIEALTKALRELVACLGEQQMDVPTPILLGARKALASAAGAEGMG